MKFYNIILFASLILYIYSDSACNSKTSADKAKDCKDLATSDAEDYCCYAKGKDENKQSLSRCVTITKENYNKIKDYIKSLEDKGYEVKKLDCKSSYLELSVLSIILLLL
jgi:hypothetical protein